MIITHPLLFNIIVVLFIAFTSGWLVYVLISKRAADLKDRMEALENEKEELRQHAQQLETQLQKAYPLNSTPVISLAASRKGNSKASDAGSM